jgi:arylsulfatase A-like enzyme
MRPGGARGAVWAVPQFLAPATGGEDRNLILISLDTLRADHLSGYGFRRPTSPAIDQELIRRGTAFTDVIATFPQTDISHLSLFSSLYPSAQPTRGRIGAEDRLVLLAERLQSAGFETAAYTEDALVSGAFGFWFGFDRFTERSFAHADRGRPTIEDGVRYVASHRDRRFFLFLHTYKTHDPYVPSEAYRKLWTDPQQWKEGGPAPLVPPQHRELVDRYNRTIREADALVAELLGALDAVGLADRTYVVLLSDHGESFGEHGMTGHGFTPHLEQLRVPLILRGPGIPEGLRIRTPSSLVDVTPTLLDLLGVEPLEQAQGVSLKKALEGVALAPDRPLYFSWLRKEAEGVRHGRWKYHRAKGGHELFDLEKDPYEWKPGGKETAPAKETELLDAHAADGAKRREELAGSAEKGPSAIDEKTEKSLKALGYLKD